MQAAMDQAVLAPDPVTTAADAAAATPNMYEQAGAWLEDVVPWLGEHHLLNNSLAAWAVAVLAVTVLFFVLSAIRGIILVRAKVLLRQRQTPDRKSVV